MLQSSVLLLLWVWVWRVKHSNKWQTVRRWRPNVIHRKHVTNTSEKEGGIIPPVLKVGGTDPPYPPRLRRLCMGYERLLAAWLYWVLCTTVNVQQITHTVIILVNVTVIMPTEQRIAKHRITKCASVRAAELRHSQRLRSVRTSLQVFLKYHTQNNYDYSNTWLYIHPSIHPCLFAQSKIHVDNSMR